MKKNQQKKKSEIPLTELELDLKRITDYCLNPAGKIKSHQISKLTLEELTKNHAFLNENAHLFDPMIQATAKKLKVFLKDKMTRSTKVVALSLEPKCMVLTTIVPIVVAVSEKETINL